MLVSKGAFSHHEGMKLTHLGHACFSVALPVDCGGARLLFDPFLTSNPLAQAAGLSAGKIGADYVLISHGHFDHVEDAVAVLKRTGAKAVAAYEICDWLKAQGVAEGQLLPMNIGGTLRLDFGTVQMVAAVHSSTLPDGASGGNPGGFVVRTGAGAFYYSGDTALTLDMQLIPRKGALRFAILCVGDTFTMGPEDALEAARMVECDEVVGVHCDTWPPIAIDSKEAKGLFKKAGKTLHLLKPGEEIDFA
jgi:L-ascorbate metabolism protein UlaG (beta-lactamase superfamily)